MDSETSLEVSKENKFLQLPASVPEIITAMETYQELLKKLLVDEDYAVIQNKKCIKKSGWLKLALAFNLSIKITEERKEIDPENPEYFAYHISVECKAGNGRTTAEVGTCDTREKPKENEHVIRSMAMTRAKSRAIASMIGASESSAEEMESVKTQTNTSNSTEPSTTVSDAPSQKQLDYLKSLGYVGPKPDTKQIASNIIEDLKKDAKDAEIIHDEKYCICDKFIPNSLSQGKTCQTCLKLPRAEK